MKRIHIIFILILVFGSFSAFSQQGTLSGVISEVDSELPLPGVEVSLKNTDFRTRTAANGSFIIKDIPVGSYELKVKTIGYESLTSLVEVTTESDFLEIQLEELVSDLPGVTIVAEGRSGIKKIPGSVYYLSPKDLDKFSYTDINRALRNVPGVNYQEEDGFGLRPNIGMRGSGVERSNKITIMEDGILAAPAPYSAPAAYYFPNIGRMHGLEVMMGSSAIEHGPYTTGGALNFISTPIPDDFSGKVNILGGRFGGRQVHAVVGNSHKNVAYMVETLQFGSNGFKTLDNGGDTGFERTDFTAKIRVNTNPDARFNQSLTFKLGAASETSEDTYLGLTESDFEATPYRRYAGSQADVMNTSYTQLSATHNINFSKKLSLTTVVYRNDFGRNWYKLDKVINSDTVANSIANVLDNPNSSGNALDVLTGSNSLPGALQVKANNRDYYAQGVQTRLNYEFGPEKYNQSLKFSVRYHEDQMDRFQWVDDYTMNNGTMMLHESGTPGTESNRIESARALASFVHYSIDFGRLTITPGLRHEMIEMHRLNYGTNDPERTGVNISERSNSVNVFIPGVGFRYAINENLDGFAGVHKGFSPPGSNPDTRPEESWNFELGARYHKKGFRFQSTVFYNDYSNLLGSDLAAAGAVGTGDLFNGGTARTMGLEVFGVYDLMRLFSKDSKFSIPVTLNYTYTNSVFTSDFDSDFGEWGSVARMDRLPYLAPHQLGTMIGLEHDLFAFNLSARYMGEMRTVPGQGTIAPETKLADYIVVDASVTFIMHKYVSLFGSVTNMLNETYAVALRPSGYRPGMPLSFNLGLKASF